MLVAGQLLAAQAAAMPLRILKSSKAQPLTIFSMVIARRMTASKAALVMTSLRGLLAQIFMMVAQVKIVFIL